MSTAISLGVWSSIGEPRTAAALTTLGFDWLCLDAQHGGFDDASVWATLAAYRDASTKVMVRVRSGDFGLIGRALDAGADGVIVPMVNSPEEAALAVSGAFYPPKGERSWGLRIGGYSAPPPTPAEGNSRVLCGVMIETTRALESVDDIAAVPGVGMLFAGPFDLSFALGVSLDELLADFSPDSPLSRIVAACRKSGIIAATIGATPERSVVLARHGFTMIATATDSLLLELGADQVRRLAPTET